MVHASGCRVYILLTKKKCDSNFRNNFLIHIKLKGCISVYYSTVKCFGITDPENMKNALLCSITEVVTSVGPVTLKPFT